MLQVEMSASVRKETGKGAMRRLRDQGQTPAVMYGIGPEALSLQLDSKQLMKQLLEIYRRNTVITMKIDNGEDKSVMIKEVQTDPVKDTLVHADFQEIDLEKVRKYNVPVEYKGKAKGIDLGGIQNVFLDSVLLEGKPLDIPDVVEVETSDLAIGDSIKVSDITVPEAVKLLTKAETVCVNVEAPAAG